ncbi:MAG: 30S ribosome-binding factor RbfA [Candidatus Margulisbacteria bacterium]|jgi:ribosome-binding factor A|nr:30S ribosome-binding factor RbfA [Candidatus Margulisiibacteriota bacterium]
MTRQERVEELLRSEVSEIIRAQVDDPRIGFISITGVDVSPDLENARINVSILGTEEQKRDAMDGLHSATRYIRGELGHRVELRLVPKITFVRDDSLERGSRVLGIMNRLGNETGVRQNKRAAKKR